MAPERKGVLEIHRMPNGDVRLEFRAEHAHHWEVVGSLHVTAGDWIAIIAKAANLKGDDALLIAGDFHLQGMFEDG